MKSFKELGIEQDQDDLVGDKIAVHKVLDEQIAIYGYRIEDSKFQDRGNGKCLYLQIEFKGEKRVLFTGSVALQNLIIKIPKEELPITTTIIKQNNKMMFS